ncbi:putative protein phosphatase 2C 26 isoform X1 [Iris pallida]|uniref:protein-serine/threonine phosphatase n=1 Tax=Iris pallida TaxID=29817 RepID=A0AAX6HIN3_IRIPA|nr:putative protein phosphatase 2C 26 isoform X1 [Iris pallida]
MGSGASRHLLGCLPCSAAASVGGADDGAGEDHGLGPLDETLGHSFCYVTAGSTAASAADVSDSDSAFRLISGASVSANSSAPVPIYDSLTSTSAAARSHFRSSSSFSAIPLQLAGGGAGAPSGVAASGPLDRGFFLSGPLERGSSGPLDSFSGPLVKKSRKRGISGRIKRASLLPRSFSEKNRPWVVPLRSFPRKKCESNGEDDDDDVAGGGCGNVQWAHGKAGEDRVHVVVSEEHRWLFVGIYDGFNGPEAPEFLVDNLYKSVFAELKGLFWEEEEDDNDGEGGVGQEVAFRKLWEFLADGDEDGGLEFTGSGRFGHSLSKLRSGFGSWRKDERPKSKPLQEDGGKARMRRKVGAVSDHESVLRALERALGVAENAYLEMTDRVIDCNPELALMGSCLLVVLMRDEDVYVMNLGDSRAIVAQYREKRATGENKLGGDSDKEIDRIGEKVDRVEILVPGREAMQLGTLQLSTDHSTSIPEEVLRIREEHPDDDQCVTNGRVKGRLKVTRAFGAGYLKHPRWNDTLLEMFRSEYIGSKPYISCIPSLCHHRLGTNDQFLVLSSDGLYQYLNNDEVVLHVESFMERFPDGDPAQSLIEELLFRAAKEAGMDFSQLLDIPQGDRRKYHDDVTVMVISLEGRIWKSSGKYV